MNPLKIKTEWDNETSVWVAISDDVDGLAIEAKTLDALIKRLKIVIPELMEANHKSQAEDELPFYLAGFSTSKTTLQQAELSKQF